MISTVKQTCEIFSTREQGWGCQIFRSAIVWSVIMIYCKSLPSSFQTQIALYLPCWLVLRWSADITILSSQFILLLPFLVFSFSQPPQDTRGTLILPIPSYAHWFQNYFCFRSTTFPTHVGTFGQQILVLHCNYNGDVAPKFALAITFERGVQSP